jgi:hypothetical protein
MKSSTKFFAIIIGIALVCFAISVVLDGPRSSLAGFKKSRHQDFTSLQVGDSIQSVVQKLGPPLRSGDRFLLPQKQGFEEEFRKAELSESKTYSLWLNGSNWYYCIGFDADGKLVIKAEGHS